MRFYKLNKQKQGRYFAIHCWLKVHYGKAYKCENPNCEYKEAKFFTWSLIKGKKHEHNRENYWMLCRGCHQKYDGVNKGEKSYLWKGGKPRCKECNKELTTYKAKTGLCLKCKNKQFPYWLGKSRKEYNLNQTMAKTT